MRLDSKTEMDSSVIKHPLFPRLFLKGPHAKARGDRRAVSAGEKDQRFLKPGSFSLARKAAMASFWSSVAKHRAKASLS